MFQNTSRSLNSKKRRGKNSLPSFVLASRCPLLRAQNKEGRRRPRPKGTSGEPKGANLHGTMASAGTLLRAYLLRRAGGGGFSVQSFPADFSIFLRFPAASPRMDSSQGRQIPFSSPVGLPQTMQRFSMDPMGRFLFFKKGEWQQNGKGPRSGTQRVQDREGPFAMSTRGGAAEAELTGRPEGTTSNVLKTGLPHLGRPCSFARERTGHWWLPWTSNPVAGCDPVCGGFDSHTLPPSSLCSGCRL